MWSILANPYKFMAFSKYAIPIGFTIGVVLFGYSLWQGLLVVPTDEVQGGDIFRAMFIHVPSAWLCMGLYTGLAIASFVWFIWRHELADVAARAIAPLGAAYTALCLATGAIWGKPTWGTWWLWDDARMMSVLVLFFLFLGYMALRAALETRQKAARAGAILAMIGVINVPLIKFSVDIWSSIHQGPSVIRADGPAMAAVYLEPLLIGFAGQLLFVSALVLILMRAEIYSQQTSVILARRLSEG
ncbi:MAG: heme ABC transporter permease CcmC [Pseudomonadota bacterium]|nr:heme ABC transporter permease CcmC [Pseudomonadota bacterium]